jgi:hypothetical protein
MKLNKLTVTFGIIALLTMATAAFSQKVRYNFAQGTDFSQYKTYKWVKVENRDYPNQLLDDQIMASIDKQLARKGLTKIESGKPDVVVVYQVSLSRETQWNSYGTGGYGWGWGGWRGWGGHSTYGSTSTLTVGTLNVDFYDVQTKKQIWRGEATKTLDQPKDAEKLQARLDKATERLLKNYPPPQKK